EPFLEAKLAPKGAGAGLTAVIPDGMRALSVKVNDVIGVAGFVVPGSRVDVILTGSADSNRSSDTSKIILENVEVLAAGQNIERDAQGKPQSVQVVTLTVTPEQAQKLALASQDGKIQLALRNPLDLDHSNPNPTYRAALYNESSSHSKPVEQVVRKRAPVRTVPRPQPPKPEVTEPKTLTVEVIAGQDRKVLTFENKKTDSR
ncbi:MAG: Flp pilus assembly protein CpaB, partial [Acidobacteriota bacterium]